MKKLILITFLILFQPLLGQAAEEKNIYTDKKRGFSVEVPAGWEVAPQKKGDVAVALVKRMPLKPFSPTIVISQLDVNILMPSTKAELGQIVNQISGPSRKIPNIEKFKIIKKGLDPKRWDAAFFYQTSYELKRVDNPKEKKVTALNYIFLEKAHYFAISLVAPSKEFKKFQKICYTVIDSLKLLETAKSKKTKN